MRKGEWVVGGRKRCKRNATAAIIIPMSPLMKSSPENEKN